jgi:D-alanine-D-alanine ligase
MEELPLEAQEEESDKPPSISPRPANSWHVAVIANIKGETALPYNGPDDAGAEFDRKETIQAILDAIASDGHRVSFHSADDNLPYTLTKHRPDLCFNIAEGQGGDAREAQVPALLELLRIPYTASQVLANAIALDKTVTKRIWRDCGLPIAEFQEFVTGTEPVSPALRFPLFVKPAREGTGMGMSSDSIVETPAQLYRQVAWVIQKYNQPALVEEYLPGREFTMGVLGRAGSFGCTPHPEYYESDGFHRFPPLEVDNSSSVTPGVYGHAAKQLGWDEAGVPGFICPAPVEPDLARQMQDLARKAHLAIGALDVSRSDIRLDAEGRPRLIEINSLPGLTPGFSDLCVMARAEGISYRNLILEILYLGASRYGMLYTPARTTVKTIRAATFHQPLSSVTSRERLWLKPE